MIVANISGNHGHPSGAKENIGSAFAADTFCNANLGQSLPAPREYGAWVMPTEQPHPVFPVTPPAT